MLTEKYDFYSPGNFKLKDLDKDLQNSLTAMNNLDYMTETHCHNVANLCTRICEYMHCNNKFTLHCMIAGYIHDIGKLFIPKEIVQKNGPLTDEEFEIMKTHTTLGYEYCMKDPYLRQFSDGPLYHHESLNGTGYPQGLKKKDIPYSAQIIRVADEYDALITTRHYTTHINISKILQTLMKDVVPDESIIALDNLSQKERVGKISPEPLRALFKAVIDDTLFEISSIMTYLDYLKSEIRRLDHIEKYDKKRLKAKNEKQQEYYLAGMKLLMQPGETIENYKQIRDEFYKAIELRKGRIDLLHKEIKIMKKMRV